MGVLAAACSLVVALTAPSLFGGVTPRGALLYVDFARDPKGRCRLVGARWGDLEHDPLQAAHGPALEFSGPYQYAEVDLPTGALDGAAAVTVGGWFYTRRSGEQYFLSRGVPQVDPLGNRIFRPRNDWVNFVLGTDEHGFFLGTIHGNGSLPFAYVTVNEVLINHWNQLVVVRDAEGYHKWYQNGVLIHTDREAAAAPMARPFREVTQGEPVRLAMGMGGLIGEIWVFARELSPEEILNDFLTKREHYKPAMPGKPVALRPMHEHPSASLWSQPIEAASWRKVRRRILEGLFKVFGQFPEEKVPLDPQVLSETDCGSYLRRKISIQVQRGDRMPAYLLIPKDRKGRLPAVICFYGTTAGAGKDTTVGLSGPRPGTPPAKNRAFALDVVQAGFVAVAADYLRDGERIASGGTPYDTTDFYRKFPEWSIHGKDAWDNMRLIDYLQSLDFVDPGRIGMLGHSYGGHSTIFAAALDERIRVAVANGPVSDFRHHGPHWAVLPGARSSQSLPKMRRYVLDFTLPIPVTFYEITALIAPRPLWVGQAVGERRPMEEENCAAVSQVYRALGYPERVRYLWYAGDHDFPPLARRAAIEWFQFWFAQSKEAP